jgi:hypothetical protein
MVMQRHAPPPSKDPRAVPPEIQRRRDEAHEKMLVLLDEIQRGEREVPLYMLTQDFFDGWSLIPALKPASQKGGQETYNHIRFDRIPNEFMLPKNPIAREVYGLYMESIGGATPDLGDQTYEAHRNRPRYEDAPVFPSRAPQRSTGAQIVEPAKLFTPPRLLLWEL